MAATTKKRKRSNNDEGFVLIGALLILMLLMIIGIAATTNTSLELQIAGNDRTHKETFYQADGGTRLAARLVEENLGAGNFTALTAEDVLKDPTDPNNTTVLVENPTFSNNDDTTRDEDSVSDTVRDLAYFPNGYDPTNPNAIPHTNIIFDGDTKIPDGWGLQMFARYEGIGHGGAGEIVYNIFSQHMGQSNSKSVIEIRWRHFIGLELEGRY